MKKRYLVIMILLLTSVLVNYSYAQTTTLTVGGKSRNMIVYAPSGIAQNRPLIIQMHGLNQDAAYQKAQAKWESIADTGKFIVVFPNGINKSWDISGTSDIDFITAIIDNMSSKYGIDKNRVYLSGFSMGGMMTYHAMGKIADKIAAFAPVSGYTLGGATFASSRPIPILHTHGDADDVVNYGGVANIMSGWVKRDNCPTTAKITKPYPSTKANSTTTKSYWGLGDCQTEVVLMTLAGKGHWYSTDINGGTHTSVEIWNFCKRYTTSCGVQSSTTVALTSPVANATFTAPASITFNATATKTGGSITKVEFYNGTTKLGEDATSPYSYSWTNVVAGTYSITAVATDNSGSKTTSTAVSIKVNVPQGPYNGIVHPILGTIQAEEYDLGGNGVAYSDDTPGSEVTPVVNYRTDEDVDIETCTDAGGGYNLGYATAGEWLEYTVNVAATGNYKLDLRVACNGDGRTISLAMDGINVASNITIPNTTGWQTWTTTTINNVPLTAGQHVLRLTIGATSYVNINYMTFSSVITGTEEASIQNSLTVYPNPFENTIHLNKAGEFNYKLYDSLGRLLLQGRAEGETSIGESLQTGLYLLDIQSKTGSQLLKVYKK
jgi:poly(3-hydroxybutyrate) depolymerase